MRGAARCGRATNVDSNRSLVKAGTEMQAKASHIKTSHQSPWPSAREEQQQTNNEHRKTGRDEYDTKNENRRRPEKKEKEKAQKDGNETENEKDDMRRKGK